VPKRKTVEDRLDSLDRAKGAISAPWGLKVDVYPVEHLDPAPWQIVRCPGSGGQPEYPWACDPGGVFAVEGYLRRRGFPPLTRSYDSALEADELFIAAATLDVNDDAVLLAFVNRWGLLECAKPPRKHVDSVAQTRVTLASFQQLARWLSALHHKRWTSKACPTVHEIGLMVGDRDAENTWEVSRKQLPEVQAAAFALALGGQLEGAALHPVMTAPRLLLGKPPWVPEMTGKRLDLVLGVERLSDFLFLDLARRVRPDHSLLRACKGCSIVFPVAATNLKKRYHAVTCKNRRAFKKWYRNPNNRRAHNARRRRA